MKTGDRVRIKKFGIETGPAYKIPIQLKQVQKTLTQTVGIPASYGKSGATGTSAGKISTSGVGDLGMSDAYNRGFALVTGGLG